MAMAYIKIFFNWPNVTRMLSHEEKGRLIDAMVLYARDGSGEELLTGNERVIFPQFQAQLDHAAAKYARACLKNQESRIEEQRIEEQRIEEQEQESNEVLLQKNDDNWRASARARGATAQLLVDSCISENLPCSRATNLHDEFVRAMERGLEPAVILDCCRRAGEVDLGYALYAAMKERGLKPA